jgi:hypothetical protein
MGAVATVLHQAHGIISRGVSGDDYFDNYQIITQRKLFIEDSVPRELFAIVNNTN